MRHQRSGKKLGRDSAHRKALFANLTAALIEHGRIRTTETKAKAVRPIAEKMITLGRDGLDPCPPAGARLPALAGDRAPAVLRGRAAVRRSGRAATRAIVKLGPRQGDAAPMAYLELVDFVPGGGERAKAPRRAAGCAGASSEPAEQAEASAS